jgi:hypothetical protein
MKPYKYKRLKTYPCIYANMGCKTHPRKYKVPYGENLWVCAKHWGKAWHEHCEENREALMASGAI